MRSKFKLLLFVFLTGFCSVMDASAQTTSLYLEDFTTNQTLRFTFGAFDLSSLPTAVSFSPAGVSTNIPESSDSFGGLGVNPATPEVDITGTTSIEVVARVDSGNQSDLVISIREAPTGDQERGEFFSYSVSASNFPVGGGFVTVSIDPTSGFNGDVTDGVLNGQLSDTGIQSPFNGTAAHHYTIQSVEFIGPDQGPGPDSNEDCLAPVFAHGALSVSGTNIVDENNNIVSFAGNSMFWSNTGFGAEKYYTSELVQWLQEDWDATIVRAAMGVDEFGGFLSDPEGNQNRVETIVDAAIDNGMYVIIDWHSHHAEDFQDDAVSFFTEMAQTYGHQPNIIYEIYNEPITRDWSGTIKPYAEEVIAAIRAIDPDNLIIVGTGFFSQDVDLASEDPITGFDNIAYTLHFYAGTHGENLRQRAGTAIDNGLALMVTEWGTVNATGDGDVDELSTEEWLLFMEMHNMSHLNWSVHDKLEGASILRPNASPTGGWPDSDLTESGLYVRGIIRDWFTCAEIVVPPILLGDCNLDGVVDFADIPSFIDILSSGEFLEVADCNQDGVVDFADIPEFISILSAG